MHTVSVSMPHVPDPKRSRKIRDTLNNLILKVCFSHTPDSSSQFHQRALPHLPVLVLCAVAPELADVGARSVATRTSGVGAVRACGSPLLAWCAQVGLPFFQIEGTVRIPPLCPLTLWFRFITPGAHVSAPPCLRRSSSGTSAPRSPAVPVVAPA